METTPFEKFILLNLYNLWKEHGAGKVKTLESLIEEYDFKEKNIGKPMKRLISAGLVDADSYCAWLTKKGVSQMDAAIPSDESVVTSGDKAPVDIAIDFLKNFEQAIDKSKLQSFEREMWLSGIKQMSQNPVLLKTLKTALEATTGKSVS